MALDIEAVRPRVLSNDSLRGLRRLLAFRHFFRHAYAVSLEAPKLEILRDETRMRSSGTWTRWMRTWLLSRVVPWSPSRNIRWYEQESDITSCPKSCRTSH